MCPRLLSRRRVILRSSRTHTHTHGQRECWEEEKSKRCADYDGLSLSSSCSLHLIWQLPIIQFFGYCSWARPSNGRCLCFSLKKRENINKKNDFLQGRVKCVIFFALRIFRGPAIHRPIWQSKLKRPKKEKLRLWIKSSRNHVLSPFLFFRSRAKRKKEKPQRWMDGWMERGDFLSLHGSLYVWDDDESLGSRIFFLFFSAFVMSLARLNRWKCCWKSSSLAGTAT